jgi:hypothetical protein
MSTMWAASEKMLGIAHRQDAPYRRFEGAPEVPIWRADLLLVCRVLVRSFWRVS